MFHQFRKQISYLTFISATLLIIGCTQLTTKLGFNTQQEKITSPNGRLELEVLPHFSLLPQFTLTFDKKQILLPSTVNLQATGTPTKRHSLEFVSTQQVDANWPLPWGQFKTLTDKYHGITYKLVDNDTGIAFSTIEFRLYDDALAIKHALTENAAKIGQNFTEQTEFHLAEDMKMWSYNGMKPVRQTNSIKLSDAQQIQIPALLTSDSKLALAIQEAGRFETAMVNLSTHLNQQKIKINSQPLNSHATTASTAWRVLQIADTPSALITSQTLMNLSPQNQLDDTDWIKPGKSFWDWRVRGQQYGDHTYALDNESLQRMINFAADNNMQYVMIDANWYGPEHNAKSDPFTEIDGLNIKQLIQQANTQGVGFILYLNDKASIHHDLDELFETWASWGAAGIKYGFMKSSGKEKVEKTLKIVALAAKHKLLINFHDQPIVPSGMRRTWPNWLTREAVHAQADGKHTFTPSGFIQMAHVNALAGPLDMSNGFFKLNGLKQNRKYVRADVNSTVVGEVARALIIYSGLIILPDAPEEYLKKHDLFEFLQHMPATWDESKVLSSDINEHIITARRTDKTWFIGAANNEIARTIPLSLDFLQAEQDYLATVYSDAQDAHYKKNRESYEISTKVVTKKDLLEIQMAAGGGQAIWIRPIESAMSLD